MHDNFDYEAKLATTLARARAPRPDREAMGAAGAIVAGTATQEQTRLGLGDSWVRRLVRAAWETSPPAAQVWDIARDSSDPRSSATTRLLAELYEPAEVRTFSEQLETLEATVQLWENEAMSMTRGAQETAAPVEHLDVSAVTGTVERDALPGGVLRSSHPADGLTIEVKHSGGPDSPVLVRAMLDPGVTLDPTVRQVAVRLQAGQRKWTVDLDIRSVHEDPVLEGAFTNEAVDLATIDRIDVVVQRATD